jgi:hypothetical protein
LIAFIVSVRVAGSALVPAAGRMTGSRSLDFEHDTPMSERLTKA